jgi:hypothetical protein
MSECTCQVVIENLQEDKDFYREEIRRLRAVLHKVLTEECNHINWAKMLAREALAEGSGE